MPPPSIPATASTADAIRPFRPPLVFEPDLDRGLDLDGVDFGFAPEFFDDDRELAELALFFEPDELELFFAVALPDEDDLEPLADDERPDELLGDELPDELLRPDAPDALFFADPLDVERLLDEDDFDLEPPDEEPDFELPDLDEPDFDELDLDDADFLEPEELDFLLEAFFVCGIFHFLLYYSDRPSMCAA